MPNHVTNRITMSNIINLPLFGEEEGNKTFDFNKIIPMPESLDMESGSLENYAIDVALGKYKYAESKAEQIAANHNLTLDDLKSLGIRYLSNLVNYGATTWLEWRREKWGTKWNAYDNSIVDDNTIQFDTAWCFPEPVIKKLSGIYPELEVRIQWSDEDTGCNTGDITYLNGTIISGGEFQNNSNEAYEMYVLLHGESNCIAKDENGQWYHKDCETCDGCK